MSFSPGTRLGAYEITSALGAGGMGQVYRARDTKLNRNVAVKIAGRPQVLFEIATLPLVGPFQPYDVTPDGRFIVIRPAQGERRGNAVPSLVLVQNWFEELRRLVSGN